MVHMCVSVSVCGHGRVLHQSSSTFEDMHIFRTPFPFPFRAFSRCLYPKGLTISTFGKRTRNIVSLSVQQGHMSRRSACKQTSMHIGSL